MTNKQHAEANTLLVELKEKYPAVDWRMTYNHYTKLPMFAGLLPQGGYSFDMWRRFNGSCDMSVEFNRTARATNGIIASNGGADETIARTEITRINWPRFLAFVREYAASISWAAENAAAEQAEIKKQLTGSISA